MIGLLKFKIQARSIIDCIATESTTFDHTIGEGWGSLFSGITMNCILTDRATNYFVMERPFSGGNMAYLKNIWITSHYKCIFVWNLFVIIKANSVNNMHSFVIGSVSSGLPYNCLIIVCNISSYSKHLSHMALRGAYKETAAPPTPPPPPLPWIHH